MKAVSYNYFSTYLKHVCDTALDEGLVVACDTPANMLLLSQREYNSIMEPVRILSSPIDAQRLRLLIQQSKERE